MPKSEVDVSVVKKLVSSLHPAADIEWIDKGQMNHIAIVAKQFVYKFPKQPSYYDLLKKENDLYILLKDKVSLPIPHAIELNDNPQFLKLSYVEGRTLSMEEASKLTTKQQDNLANKLATFIQEMNDPKLHTGIDEILIHHPNDFYYVENWLKKIAEYCSNNPSELSEKYLQLYSDFTAVLSYGFCTGNFIAHKDLHEDNMLFNDDNELVGLIDFAEVRYTSIYSELRTLTRFGLGVVDQIIDQVGSLADGVKTSEVLAFAKVYEMAVVVQDSSIKKELPWRVNLAKFYLRLWGEL